MSDYSKSVIYKYYKEDITEIYIGSTKNKIERERHHKDACNNENYKEYNYKVYKFMRENGGYDNWKFEVLEIYPCDNKIQLVEREDYYYDLLKPLLNMRRPYVSEEEMKEEKRIYDKKYNEDNKEEKKERDKKYNEDNKEVINIKQKQKHICKCGGKYTTINKARHCNTNKHKNYIEKNK